MKLAVIAATVASAAAFVPSQNARMPTRMNAEFVYGEYDDKLWDNDAKKDVYNKWDPSAPAMERTSTPSRPSRETRPMPLVSTPER